MVKSKTLLPNFLSLQFLNDFIYLFLSEGKHYVPGTQGLAVGKYVSQWLLLFSPCDLLFAKAQQRFRLAVNF